MWDPLLMWLLERGLWELHATQKQKGIAPFPAPGSPSTAPSVACPPLCAGATAEGRKDPHSLGTVCRGRPALPGWVLRGGLYPRAQGGGLQAGGHKGAAAPRPSQVGLLRLRAPAPPSQGDPRLYG